MHVKNKKSNFRGTHALFERIQKLLEGPSGRWVPRLAEALCLPASATWTAPSSSDTLIPYVHCAKHLNFVALDVHLNEKQQSNRRATRVSVHGSAQRWAHPVG